MARAAALCAIFATAGDALLFAPSPKPSPRSIAAGVVDDACRSLVSPAATSVRSRHLLGPTTMQRYADELERRRRAAQRRVEDAYAKAKSLGVAPSFGSEAPARVLAAPAQTDGEFLRATSFDVAQFENERDIARLRLTWVTSRLVGGHSGRVAAHEAGHLLAAYVLGVHAVDATLSRLDAFRFDKLERAASAPSSAFLDQALLDELKSGDAARGAARADAYAVVFMAGIAAEAMIFGDGPSGSDDDLRLKQLLALNSGTTDVSDEAFEAARRAALADALRVLGAHRVKLDRLRGHLEAHRGRSIGETMLAIDDDAAGAAPSPGFDPLKPSRRHLASAMAAFGVGVSAAPSFAGEYPEFDAIRAELDGKGTGGLRFMAERLAAEDYGELREFTKQWDLDFRKAVLGAARKAMPKGPDRDRAVLVANAVTFDLIGINKAIRKVGNEDPAEAKRWYNTLVDDITDYVTLEPKGARYVPEK